MSMQMSKTKIVCTIGPSSWDPEVMKSMIEAGMNVARVNGAFADEAELDKVTQLVRGVSNEVALMVDVKGPEVRLNKFAEPKPIKPGDIITIGNDQSAEIYPANYQNLYQQLSVGQRLVIGDGDVEFMLNAIEGDKLICEVVYGELLKPGKALNIPGVALAKSVLTEKDIVNLKHAISLGWDFVSASFMQNAAAAREVRSHLEGSHMKLIAKIEDQEGVDNIDEILKEVEGVMIARGGLGVELGLEKVPMVQRLLTEKCVAAGKPVITATQMLESMTDKPRPTRAEVNDVALAVMLGSDAVMLSGESSAGKYPVAAVKELTTVATETEKFITPEVVRTKTQPPYEADAISRAAAEMCINLEDEIGAVLVASRTGRTARMLGRHRIRQPIFAFTSKPEYARRIMLSKGVSKTYVLDQVQTDRDQAISELVKKALSLNILDRSKKVLVIGKSPMEDAFFPNIFEMVDLTKYE